MKGQLSFFDDPEKASRPCEYRFRRYIGQRVICRGKKHEIKTVGPYYTYFTDGTVGTPYDITETPK